MLYFAVLMAEKEKMDAVNIAFHLQMNCSNTLSSDSSKGIISNQCNS